LRSAYQLRNLCNPRFGEKSSTHTMRGNEPAHTIALCRLFIVSFSATRCHHVVSVGPCSECASEKNRSASSMILQSVSSIDPRRLGDCIKSRPAGGVLLHARTTAHRSPPRAPPIVPWPLNPNR
jgi:hypothetical protein